MTGESKSIDIAQLAKNIAADINKLEKAASKEALKDLKSIDLSPLLKGSIAKTLRGTTNSLKKTAEEASKRNQVAVEEVSGQLENTLKARQLKLASGLKELEKTAIKDEAGAKIILNRISKDVDLGDRRLSELQINKTVKSRKGLRIRSVS